MFNNSNKTTKHSVNKCSVLFNKFRKCLVRTASIITCTAIVATSVTPAFAAGITSGTTAASSYVISNGTTAAKSSVISNEVSTDTSVSWPQAPDITCESAILVDADTGSILYEKDAHRKCYPASTTKILTGLLTIENCNLSDTLTFSTAAANSINPIEDANLGMKAGEELTVEQALYALLLYSANEVAYALAEKVAGSIDAFVDMMNNKARELGAEGIGLCRTEHMFFEEERIPAVRRMILADSEEERREALKFLLPYQKGDFKGIYEAMGDRPVTIRLLDPPLHEFLPHTDEEIKALSEQIGVPYEKLAKKTQELHEFNPMMGHRGCRLAVTYPEIAEMQAEAIIMAAIEVRKEQGLDIIPEIMIPLVGMRKELADVKATVVKTVEAVMEREGVKFDYLIGTMIEIPRAALTADEIAEEAEFFSFGTNDLTQMTFGFSRDDTGKIIKEYREKGIFDDDPFQSIDQVGVGKLVKMAVELGKQTRPSIKLGICGEHGGDPKSIEFCNAVGLQYVSCSPFRVPIARLAAAQAAIANK